MNKARIAVATLVCLTSISTFTPLFAAQSLPSGWYLEANAGASRTSSITYASGSSLSSSGIGINVNGGYKFMPYFAAEVGYTRYAKATAKVNSVEVVSATHYSYDIAGKAILPIGDIGIDLFAKVGAAHISTSASMENTSYVIANGISVMTGSHSTNGYYFGLGADYSVIPSVAINGQWQRAKGNSRTGNLDLYSLGVSYLFG